MPNGDQIYLPGCGTAERIVARFSQNRPEPSDVRCHLGSKEPGLWIIGGQEFDNAEPVLLVLPERLEIVFVLRSQDPQITFFQSFASELAIHRRYPVCRFLRSLYYYLQGIAVRPLPCNYNVIQPESALSRR
jgi:hypothetical protein